MNLDPRWSINVAELNILRTACALLLINWVVRCPVGQEHKNKIGSHREKILQ
jgi:hypothetical protein